MNRRELLQGAVAGTATCLLGPLAWAAPSPMKLGLVTYQWGKDWDVPTIIKNCSAAQFSGVELRSTHKHGVEITLNAQERQHVRQQFADSPVELMGLGSACEYHSADAAIVRKNINETKEFIKLCHELGSGGVKVRPNGFPDGVPIEKTLEQIGQSLNEVGRFAAEHNVQIRVEVHGKGTSHVPHIKTMLEIADHPNVAVCWNCNPTDLDGDGLVANFKHVQQYLGTIHIHDLRTTTYPWQQLFTLLREANFQGWTLMEEGAVPQDIVAAMQENRVIWNQFVAD